MPRKPKNTSDSDLELDSLDEVDEMELEPDDIDDEDTVVLEVEAEEPKKPKRQPPKPRAKQEPVGVAQLLAASSTPVDEDIVEEEPAPAPKRKRSAPKAELPSTAKETQPKLAKPEIPMVESDSLIAMNQSMQSMVKQWEQIRDISGAVSTHLEKVTQLVQELPNQYASAMNDLFKAPAPKPSTMSKMAMGASAAAIIFSVLSFTLSQSLRQDLLNKDVVRTAQAPTKSVPHPSPIDVARNAMMPSTPAMANSQSKSVDEGTPIAAKAPAMIKRSQTVPEKEPKKELFPGAMKRSSIRHR